ncbi:SDR family NAD(P)-dependent oxidoreductase [Occultella aeris]|uniref:3-oxoacyl-[acyl-carrier-protein] reductase FabG n=1 Tax=Occultella aeris TaxID=2761496 RepID=A0A7M4DRF5_9MICO|nr:SDR family NAD(P)-dependent oxidoreductase [Occultella aeris]VZO40049.1 3-oxoacyl-[acyl-carrier-protein] reductase FabG [Occultella aeris]
MTDGDRTGPTAQAPLGGSVALVTGAVGALGAAICRDLARDGADIVVHHLRQDDEARALCGELEGLGARTVSVSADVTDTEEVAAALSRAQDQLGPIDILVNNAGWMESRRLVDTDLAQWRRTMSVDLDGVFIVTRQVVPGMLERGEGRIVNVSSQLAFKGATDFVAYCTAKAGLLGFTRALAREIGPTVRVNAIAPGPIDTPMVTPHATPDWVHARTRDSVIGRLGLPEEIGPAVTFLVGPGASLFHGQTLHLNGGGVLG